jgi:hypothetical protein
LLRAEISMAVLERITVAFDCTYYLNRDRHFRILIPPIHPVERKTSLVSVQISYSRCLLFSILLPLTLAHILQMVLGRACLFWAPQQTRETAFPGPRQRGKDHTSPHAQGTTPVNSELLNRANTIFRMTDSRHYLQLCIQVDLLSTSD